ncbi:Rhamnogalacturonate lyase family protein [Trifolium repens]|nr:Rhamnogalacturonate lyase family protein [Trifolium repens]
MLPINLASAGFICDYQYNNVINITSGCEINVGELVYEPARDAPTLWEIGIPDRTAAEFYVPDPNTLYLHKKDNNTYQGIPRNNIGGEYYSETWNSWIVQH